MHAGALFGGLVFLCLLVGVVLLTVFALVRLGRAPIDEIARALWVFLILTIPVFGPVAFYIVDPGSWKTKAPV